MISLASTVVASPEQISTTLYEEAVILNMDKGVYFGLNPIGAFIWNLIQQPIDVTAICEQVLANYQVERDRCERDTLALLQDMLANGLIQVQ